MRILVRHNEIQISMATEEIIDRAVDLYTNEHIYSFIPIGNVTFTTFCEWDWILQQIPKEEIGKYMLRIKNGHDTRQI